MIMSATLVQAHVAQGYGAIKVCAELTFFRTRCQAWSHGM